MGKIIDKVRKRQARAQEVRKQWAMHDAAMREPGAPLVWQRHHEALAALEPPKCRHWWKFWL